MNYYSLINTPVTHYTSGRKLGVVSDVYLKDNSTEILGFVATNRSLVYQNRLFYPEDILDISPQRVSVYGPGIRFLKTPKEPDAVSFKRLIGLKAAPENNRVRIIGTVKDGYFDMETGSLTELLIGRGFADDLINGRHLLKADSLKEENGIVKARNPSLIAKSNGLKALASRSSYDKGH